MKPDSLSLIRAASDGDADTVRALLAEGVPVNTLSTGGQSALMLAAIFGREEIAKLLLLAGADTSLVDPRGLSAREWAIRRGFLDVAKLIETHSGRKAPPPRPTNEAPVDDRYAQGRAETDPPERAATPTARMGGAAAAILRNHVVGSTEHDSVDNVPTRPDLTQPEFQKPSIETDSEFGETLRTQFQSYDAQEMIDLPAEVEFHGREVKPDEIVTEYEVSDDDRVKEVGDDAQVLPFIPKPHEAAMVPPDAIVPDLSMHDASESKSRAVDQFAEVSAQETPRENPSLLDSPETTLESSSPPPSPVKTVPARPSVRPAPPAFLAQANPPSSGRPILWLLIVVTLGLSAFGAYQLNKYLSRPQPTTSVATQPVEPAPVPTAASTPESSSAVSASTSEATGPVTGGPLAGTEVSLPVPDYPASARRKNIQAVITITVRVNRAGNVISWRTGTGDASLRAAALKAAKRSKFSPEKLPGTGEVVGTITYNFKE